MGTKLLLGFGGTVIQVVVHHIASKQNVSFGFGGTVNQAVVHQGTHEKILCRGFGKYRNSSGSSPYSRKTLNRPCFGGTVNQAVVHPCR